MKKLLLNLLSIIALLLVTLSSAFAQMGINTDGSSPDNSAMLDVKSTSRGILIPRMTQSQIEAILNPANGLQVFCTTNNKIYIYISTVNRWKEVAYGAGELVPKAIYSVGTGNDCSNTVINGFYGINVPLSSLQYINIQVNVSFAGSYSVATNIVNGYSFSASGNFSTTGLQTINLMGSGTPLSAQADQFTVTASNGGGSCTFSNTVSSWTCGQTITDARDGKIYNTVLMITQCWMKENLNIGTRIDGNNDQSNNSIIEKYCYQDLESNCDVYGGLYQWNEMMQYVTSQGIQGVCPSTLHLPTDNEWTTMYNYLLSITGYAYALGGSMKETGTTHWSSPNAYATNITAYTALPGGMRVLVSEGSWSGKTYYTYFWSSTQYDAGNAPGRRLYYDDGYLNTLNLPKGDGFSVRCILY